MSPCSNINFYFLHAWHSIQVTKMSFSGGINKTQKLTITQCHHNPTTTLILKWYLLLLSNKMHAAVGIPLAYIMPYTYSNSTSTYLIQSLTLATKHRQGVTVNSLPILSVRPSVRPCVYRMRDGPVGVVCSIPYMWRSRWYHVRGYELHFRYSRNSLCVALVLH